MMDIRQNYLVEGIYGFKAVNVNTGEERDLEGVIANDHPNMILNSGLDALGSASNIAIGCRVGTGNSAVVASQTSLDATLASTTTIQATNYGAQALEPYFLWGRRTYRFAQGTAAGNLTEVGVYSSISGNPLFSRALILDTLGNPTTLTILADEYLDVTYELRVYQDTTDVTKTVTLLGEVYNVTIRPATITSTYSSSSYFFNHILYWYTTNGFYVYNGDIGAITSDPSGSGEGTEPTLSNYVNGSYERTAILSLGLNYGNLSGGIKSLRFRTHKGCWQLGFNPVIPKDNYRTLVLNLTIGWARK